MLLTPAKTVHGLEQLDEQSIRTRSALRESVVALEIEELEGPKASAFMQVFTL